MAFGLATVKEDARAETLAHGPRLVAMLVLADELVGALPTDVVWVGCPLRLPLLG